MINLYWLKNNFSDDFVIFDIGCAGMHSEIKLFRDKFSNATIYAFDCENYWLEQNLENSIKFGIHYFHVAMDSENSTKKFIPSISENGNVHPYSGSFYKDVAASSNKVYGEPYDVPTVRLDTFCKAFRIKPDFIHIDVEGSEFNILSSMGTVKPKAIWTEIVGFQSYKCEKSFDEFNSMMDNLGYRLVYNDNSDGLYCLNTFKHTEYKT
jgi:FkbM family methyltransferase